MAKATQSPHSNASAAFASTREFSSERVAVNHPEQSQFPQIEPADLLSTHPFLLDVQADSVLEGSVDMESDGSARCFIDARFGSIGWKQIERSFVALHGLFISRLCVDPASIQLRLGVHGAHRRMYPGARMHLAKDAYAKLQRLGKTELKRCTDILLIAELWDDEKLSQMPDRLDENTINIVRQARDAMPIALPANLVVSIDGDELLRIPRTLAPARPVGSQKREETVLARPDGFRLSTRELFLVEEGGRRVVVQFDEHIHLQTVINANARQRAIHKTTVTVEGRADGTQARVLKSMDLHQHTLELREC